MEVQKEREIKAYFGIYKFLSCIVPKGYIKEWAKNKDKMFTCSYCSGRFVNLVAEGFQQGTCMRKL